MKIAVTGTPGTGKSSLARMVAKRLGYSYVDLNKEIVSKRLFSSYDRSMKSYVVDIARLRRLHPEKKDIVFDSHLSHLLPRLDVVIVLRCEPEVLRRRLKRRGYSKNKIQENVESEYIGAISWEARQRNKMAYDIDATRRIDPKLLIRTIKGKAGSQRHIDWIEKRKLINLGQESG